jgi:hypothetical protein
MVLFTTFMQTKFRPCKLNLDRTVYTVFQNIRYSSKNLNVLITIFSKQNISCFEIRWPKPIWSVNVFFMHSDSAVDIYRAQRKHINYSIWPMRISRPDSTRRYPKWYAISAGSQFTLRACSQAKLVVTCSYFCNLIGCVSGRFLRYIDRSPRVIFYRYIFVSKIYKLVFMN